MAMRKPSPSAARRALSGTRTPSNVTATVGCEFQPSFVSGGPKLSPGVPCSHIMRRHLARRER